MTAEPMTDCYYKNGEVYCNNLKDIDSILRDPEGNGWQIDGCFCVTTSDTGCSMSKCNGETCATFLVLKNCDSCEVMVVPDVYGICYGDD